MRVILCSQVSTLRELFCWYLDLTSDVCVFDLSLFMSQLWCPRYWPRVTITCGSSAERLFLSSACLLTSGPFLCFSASVPSLSARSLGLFLISIPAIYKPMPPTDSAHRVTRWDTTGRQHMAIAGPWAAANALAQGGKPQALPQVLQMIALSLSRVPVTALSHCTGSF